MASNFMGIDLSGDRALVEFINSFPDVVVKGAMRDASAKAFRPIRKAARANAKAWGTKAKATRKEPWASRWSEIAKSIVLKQKTYSRKGVVYTHVGVDMKEYPNRGRGTEPSFVPGRIAYILEYGTSAHYANKGARRFSGRGDSLVTVRASGGMHPGSAPRPFLRPAYDANKAQAHTTMTTQLRPALENAAQREARRVAKKYPAGRPA